MQTDLEDSAHEKNLYWHAWNTNTPSVEFMDKTCDSTGNNIPLPYQDSLFY